MSVHVELSVAVGAINARMGREKFFRYVGSGAEVENEEGDAVQPVHHQLGRAVGREVRARFRPSSSGRGVGEGEFANNFQRQNRIPADNEAAKREKHVGNGKRANTNPAPFTMENFTEKNAFWPRFMLAKMLTLGVRNYVFLLVFCGHGAEGQKCKKINAGLAKTSVEGV